MLPAEIQSFDTLAQTDLEESFPALILFTGADTPIECAGGNLRQTDLRAFPGGLLDDYEVFFRVKLANMSTPPDLGTRFQWKRVGEPTWRPKIANVMRVVAPAQSIAFTIYGGNPAK